MFIAIPWIDNTINQETYERWYAKINVNIRLLKGTIEKLHNDRHGVQTILHKNLDKLSDLKSIYNQCDTTQKRTFIKLGFDRGLYYKEGTYRTPHLKDELSHNYQIMREKGLLLCEKKEGLLKEVPLSGEGGIRTRGTVSSTTV